MCDYHHVIDDDLNETIMTTTDPIKAAARTAAELEAGTNVRLMHPCTVPYQGRYYYPGQLISIQEMTK